MIRELEAKELDNVMQLWLKTNIKAHNFISKEYWLHHFPLVKDRLPQAEVYVYEEDDTHQIVGFIGLTENYIAGIFVKEEAQSRGIGTQLLNYVKIFKSELHLSVYQKNMRAIDFYQKQQFEIQSETIDDNTNMKEFVMVWNK